MDVKKVFTILSLVFFLPLTAFFALAVEPTETNIFFANSTSAAGNFYLAENKVVWDDYVAVFDSYSSGFGQSQSRVQIYNYVTGNEIFDNTFNDKISCGVAQTDKAFTPYYFAGYLYLPWGIDCGTSEEFYLEVLDVSDTDFISVSSSSEKNLGAELNLYNSFDVLDEDLTEFVFIIGNDMALLNASGSIQDLPDLGFGVGIDPQAVDHENKVILISGQFYDYDIETGATNNIGNVEVFAGSVVDWNKNSLNPEYITDNGNVVIVGGSDYNDIKTSTATVGFTPMFIFERANIIGLNGTNFVIANATELSAVTTEQGVLEVPFNPFMFSRGFNTLVAFNTTSPGTIGVYETTAPDIDFVTGEEAAPTVEADFLGVDITGSFIFSTQATHPIDGRVYLSQNLFESTVDITDIVLDEVINFDSSADEDKVTGVNFGFTSSEIVGSVERLGNVSQFEQSLQLEPALDDTFRIEFTNPATSDETEIVEYGIFVTALDVFGTFEPTWDVSLESTTGQELFRYRFNYNYNTIGNDEITVERFNGAYNTVFSGDAYEVGDQKDYYAIYAVINFTNQSVDVTIYNRNSTLVEEVIPFLEPASSIKNTYVDPIQGALGGTFIYNIGSVSYTHESTIESTVSYEIFELFEEGETIVKATSIDGAHEFGDYNLYSYVTNDGLGFSYLDSFDVESFTYNEQTTILTQDDIEDLIEEISSAPGIDGFSQVDIIEGDLVTDTLFGYLDSFNIKSGASKFLVGLILVFVFLSIGISTGGSTKSEMGTMIGGLVGGVGGLFLVTYLGLFPAWVTLVVALVTFAVVAGMVRNTLVGRR